MIGVTAFPHTPEELKAVMEKEEFNWRSFSDDGSIMHKWNSPATPAYYVLDHKGVIRHKWMGHPGEKTMDAALEKLIQEAKRAIR